jgi:phosphate transport system permease protein
LVPRAGAPLGTPPEYRIHVKIGNRDIYGSDFKWIERNDIKEITYPEFAGLIETREWRNFYVFIKEIKDNNVTVAEGSRETRAAIHPSINQAEDVRAKIRKLRKRTSDT